MRILALIVKELLALFRDPRGRMVLIAPPILQLLVFSFAATLEVKNVSLAIYSQDTGKHGYELVQRLAASPTFTHIQMVNSLQALHPLIDEQKVMAAILIPQDFSRQLERGKVAKLQVILDGRRSNAAQIVSGYITQLVNGYSAEVRFKRGGDVLPTVLVGRNWFNMNLLYLWFTVPSLVAILAMLITLIVTALSVARERELGTFDQLLVSPLMPWEILVGKTVPAVLVGLAEGMLIWGFSVGVFKIPFTGSFLWLLLVLFTFVMAVVGVGLFISAISKTQQQAILGAFLFMVPAVTLSGYAAPIENMPGWLQTLTWINPLKHSLITVKGLFLKNMPFEQVWTNTWPLLVIGLVTLSIAGWFFTRRLE
ncbi:ABC transporter permease [Gynuella sp.]|uniref:ABC transporter permease n=1 Tax=Gynuella sp. TaxID=2969146 RepID=UPI003D0DF978